MMRSRLIGLISLLIMMNGLAVMNASAQGTTCSTQELLSIARAGAACTSLDAGTVCYASGNAASTSYPDSSDAGLTQLGDRISLHELETIQVTPGADGDAPLSIASLLIGLSPNAKDQLTALLVEDATLENDIVPTDDLPIRATGTVHIYAGPSTQAEVEADLSVNSGLTATGRTDDNQWLRVTVPATGQIGWVAANLVRVTGDINHLLAVDFDTEQAEPAFELNRLTSGDGSACGGTIHAGMILQTPSTDFKNAITFSVNRVAVKLAGTAFVTGDGASGALAMTVLDGAGELLVDTQAQIIPAGAQSGRTATGGILSKAAPYDAGQVAGLAPILNTLPRTFEVTAPQTQEVIDAQVTALSPTMPAPMPTATATSSPTECRLTIGRVTTARSGPGEDYEALSTIDAGTPIQPEFESTDRLGATWWELVDSRWVAQTSVVERGDCSTLVVPSAGRITAPPTNSYSLERCGSANGPVRSGQQVTFEFVPPPWDNLGAANAALQTDPGHFTINAERYRAYASAPIRLGENVNALEDRYLRRFTLVWTAQPGTYRITGDWLSYEPSCNLTVPVE